MFNKNKDDGDRIEEVREIGEDGKYKESNKDNRNNKQHKGGKYNTGGGGGGGNRNILVPIAVIALILLAINVLGSGNLVNSLKAGFTSSPLENMDSMLNAMNDTSKKSHHDAITHPVYNENELHETEYAVTMGENRYLVYAYTGIESFEDDINNWVLDYENLVPIYRMKHGLAMDVKDLEHHVDIDSINDSPFIMMVQGSGGSKSLVTVVQDVEGLDNLYNSYFKEIEE